MEWRQAARALTKDIGVKGTGAAVMWVALPTPGLEADPSDVRRAPEARASPDEGLAGHYFS
jgi:hypothetical protein